MKDFKKLVAHLKLSGDPDSLQAAEMLEAMGAMLIEKDRTIQQMAWAMEIKLHWYREKLRCSNLLK